MPSSKTLQMPEIWSADKLAKAIFPDPRWAIPGILPEGLTVLGGKPKYGKSWMALSISLAIACGGVALGQIPVEAGEVLYLALEDRKRRLKERINRLTNGEAVPDRLYLATEWSRMGEGGLKLLDQWLSEHPDCRLVVIDTLAKIRRAVEARNAYQEDYRTGEAIKAVADEHGVCILIVHHVRKQISGDALEDISGTFGLTGAADGTIVIVRERGKADAVLHITGRDVEDQQLGIKWDPMTVQWSLMGDAETFRESLERQKIKKILAESGGVALGVRDITHGIGGKEGNVKRMLYRMAEEGQIRNVGEGKFLPITRESDAGSSPTSVTRVTPVTQKPSPNGHGDTDSLSYRVTRVTQVTHGDSSDQSDNGDTSDTHRDVAVSLAECLQCGKPLGAGEIELCLDCEMEVLTR